MTIYIALAGKSTKLIPENLRIGQGSFNRRANKLGGEPDREKQKSRHRQVGNYISRSVWPGFIAGWEVDGRCTLPACQFDVRSSVEARGLGQAIRV